MSESSPSGRGLAWQDLQLRYGGPSARLLDFGTLALPPAATLVLRGDSGSGKSSLLALIAGLLTPTAGRLHFGEVDLGALSPAQRDAWRGARLGFVPQRLHLSEALSVQANLEMPFFAAGVPVDRPRVQAVLQRLGLADLAARRPAALSVGQAQRVAVARALVRQPALVLADEPTASLDDTQAAAALQLLREAAADAGATLVVATHDARVVQALAEAHTLRLPRSAAAEAAA